MTSYPLVFRFLSPQGLRGRLCRIVDKPPPVRDRSGDILYATGGLSIKIELDDGTLIVAQRGAVVPVDSRMGRQVMAKVARGGSRPKASRRTSAAA